MQRDTVSLVLQYTTHATLAMAAGTQFTLM